MDRKNINRGFKKLRVWQDAVSLYVLACKIFADFPFELKKVAGNSNEPPRGKPRGIFKGKINFIAAPLGGISASLQQAAGN